MKAVTRNWIPILIGIIIVAVIAVGITIFRSGRGEERNVGYGGKPITDSVAPDWSGVTQRNAEGFKEDPEGFIPLANDGGPMEFTFISADSGQDAVTVAICRYSQDFVTKRSRENRSDIFQYIRSESGELGKINDLSQKSRDIKEMADAISGYNLGNPQILRLSRACEDIK